jgi:hypothetical protein
MPDGGARKLRFAPRRPEKKGLRQLIQDFGRGRSPSCLRVDEQRPYKGKRAALFCYGCVQLLPIHFGQDLAGYFRRCADENAEVFDERRFFGM